MFAYNKQFFNADDFEKDKIFKKESHCDWRNMDINSSRLIQYFIQ